MCEHSFIAKKYNEILKGNIWHKHINVPESKDYQCLNGKIFRDYVEKISFLI